MGNKRLRRIVGSSRTREKAELERGKLAANRAMAKRTKTLQCGTVTAKVARTLWGECRSRAGAPNCQKKGYVWKRMRLSPAVAVNPQAVQAKRLDWEMLKLWAECGLIRLLYLDECGC